jgi:hypothetical protein
VRIKVPVDESRIAIKGSLSPPGQVGETLAGTLAVYPTIGISLKPVVPTTYTFGRAGTWMGTGLGLSDRLSSAIPLPDAEALLGAGAVPEMKVVKRTVAPVGSNLVT